MPRKIPASLTKAYNRAIKRQGGASERAVKAALTEYIAENPEATVEELREFSIELLKSAGELYGNACSQAAFDLQNEIAREFGAKPPNTGGWYYEPDAESIEKTAHYHAGKLVDGDVAGFVREIGSAARFYAERGANATMVETAKKQDRKNRRSKRTGARMYGVTFARVPQGTTTCEFCIMLASRGFVYLTEESAGEFDKFHKNCDCRIVPGYPGMELEGYDPDLYYDMWKNPEKYSQDAKKSNSQFVDGPDVQSLRVRDYSLSVKYTPPDSLETLDTFTRYDAVELARYSVNADRLPGWVKKQDGATPDEWEEKTADVLASIGFDVRFKTRSLSRRRADAAIDGKRWEFKNPSGSGYLCVHNQIKSNLYGENKHKLKPQSSRVVISNVRSTLTLDQMEEQLRRVMDGESGFTEKELSKIEAVLLLDKNGQARLFRFKK